MADRQMTKMIVIERNTNKLERCFFLPDSGTIMGSARDFFTADTVIKRSVVMRVKCDP